MKAETEGIWDSSAGVANLLRNRVSGRYYTRVQVGGRRRMQSLKTDVLSVAKLRHAETITKVQRQRMSRQRLETGSGLMGDLIDRHQAEYLANTARAAKSKASMKSSTERLVNQWAKCFGADLRLVKPYKITVDQVRRFANFLHGEARFQQHNNRRSKLGYKAVTVNTTVELLYRILRMGVETGAIAMLPFDLNPIIGGPIRKPETQKKVRLPSAEQMRKLFAEMARVPDASNLVEMRAYLADRGAESTELAEFMAYSGARINEAVSFDWADDLANSVILRGTKTAGSRDREVPKIEALRVLLKRMRARRIEKERKVTGRAFQIRQCREALAGACARVGVERLTHQSLRHFFVTMCIEAGVDMPTISRWLGHADGGVLAMKTYGHLRMEHSFAAAAKVTFQAGGPTT